MSDRRNSVDPNTLPNVSTNSSSQESSARHQEMAEKIAAAGLAALKQKQYAAAIAQLKMVNAKVVPDATYVKVQMGLVKAYVRTEQVKLAIAICQPLCQHSNAQVQAWAQQTWQELMQRRTDAPQLNQLEETVENVITVDEIAGDEIAGDEIAGDEIAGDEIARDSTGFVPLHQGTVQNRVSAVKAKVVEQSWQTAIDGTGLMPIANPPSQRQGVVSRSTGETATGKIAARQTAARQTAARQTAARQTAARTTVTEKTVEPSELAARSLNQEAAMLQDAPASSQNATAFVQQAGDRLAQGTSLGRITYWQLWALMAGSIVAFFWLICQLPLWTKDILIWMLNRLPFSGFLLSLIPYDFNPTSVITLILSTLFLASPWLFDLLLRHVYQQQSFSLVELAKHSPEATRLLGQVCQQRRWQTPTLKLLPLPLPLIFSYGLPKLHDKLPQTARIVVSQGLLDRLEADEIAALYAAELAHLMHGDGAILSGLTLVAQLPFLIYWKVASWGDLRQGDAALQPIAIFLSAAAYGLFRFCCLPGLWLSRIRLYYSDRTATELTGNPNGLTRSLLKLAIATQQTLKTQGHTPALLESLELLTPVGYRNALSFCTPSDRFEAIDLNLITWDKRHPWRRWLSLCQPHPGLGDRLHHLSRYAHQFRLPSPIPPSSHLPRSASFRPLLLQNLPLLSAIAGLLVGLLAWGIGYLSYPLFWLEWTWMAGDRHLLTACILLGFSVGTFLRINPFFPDIKRPRLQVDPDLTELCRSPHALPIDSHPIRIKGKLLGRTGFKNWLHQDLCLQTETGLIRLHFTSRFGIISNLLIQEPRPQSLIGRSIVVSGWFRRGVTPWIDVEAMQSQQGSKTVPGDHAWWSTLLACGTTLLAVYLIFTGTGSTP